MTDIRPRVRLAKIVAYPDGPTALSEARIRDALESHTGIKCYAYILHDRDVRPNVEPATGDRLTEERVVRAHWHVLLGLHSNTPVEAIAHWFGLPPSLVERVNVEPWSNRKLAFWEMVRYYLHESPSATGKYHYPDAALHVSCADWRQKMESHCNELDTREHTYRDRHRANVTVPTWYGQLTQYERRLIDTEHFLTVGSIISETGRRAREDLLAHALSDGRLTLDEATAIGPLRHVLTDNPTRFEKAADICNHRLWQDNLTSFDQGEYCKRVVYVYGRSGTGKTCFVEAQIRSLQEEHNAWRCYRATAERALDGYQGEEIILIDDAPPDALNVTDWLHLLDPFHAFPAHARFHDKDRIAPRFLFITTVEAPAQFFASTKERAGREEELEQFIRRLFEVVELGKTSASVFIPRRLPEGRPMHVSVKPRFYSPYSRSTSPEDLERDLAYGWDPDSPALRILLPGNWQDHVRTLVGMRLMDLEAS